VADNNEIPTLDEIAGVVQQTGQYALDQWRDGKAPDAKIWNKADGDPVCEIDIAVDHLLKVKLQQLCPTAGWLSEETADDAERLGHRLNWSVDPIDGTRDYINGRAGWCVSVALLDGDKPISAVLAAPAQDALWTASAGGGAFRNGRRIWASKRKMIKGARIPADKLIQDDDALTLVEKPNSIALRMAMVAIDQADLVASVRLGNEWDIVAAHLIAHEAGAFVGNAYGETIKYNKFKPTDYGMICCAKDLRSDVLNRIKPYVDRVFDH